MIFVAGRALCQKTAASIPPAGGLHFYRLAVSQPVKKAGLPLAPGKTSSTYAGNIVKETGIPPIVPANYYTTNLGFFCKKELQFEKLTKLPFKFRLGSVQQCDRLEGKVTAITQ